jgi:hypothetical protein
MSQSSILNSTQTGIVALPTTKGDIISHDGTSNVRVPVGTNGHAFVANSSQSAGVHWTSVTTTTTDNFKVIATSALTTNTSAVEYTSLSTYRVVRVIVTGRATDSSIGGTIRLNLNNSASTEHYYQLFGSSSSVYLTNGYGGNSYGITWEMLNTSGSDSSSKSLFIMEWATGLGEMKADIKSSVLNGTESRIQYGRIGVEDQSGVSTLRLEANFASGSTITVYGILA